MFNILTDEEKTLLNEKTHLEVGVITLATMFEYDGLDFLTSRRIEPLLARYGKVAFWKHNGVLVVSRCEFTGELNDYGLGVNLIATLENGVNITFENWVNSSEVAVMFNNALGSRDLALYKYAYDMTELDISLAYAVKYTRMLKIPLADDDKHAKQLEKALSDVFKGKMSIVEYKNVLRDLTGDTDLKTLDLTDPSKTDVINTLLQAQHTITNNFSELYGQSRSNDNGKKAQLSVDEFNGAMSNSLILPTDRLNCRKIAIDDVNAKFGTAISVDFSECWKAQHETAVDLEDEPITDESEVEDNV